MTDSFHFSIGTVPVHVGPVLATFIGLSPELRAFFASLQDNPRDHAQAYSLPHYGVAYVDVRAGAYPQITVDMSVAGADFIFSWYGHSGAEYLIIDDGRLPAAGPPYAVTLDQIVTLPDPLAFLGPKVLSGYKSGGSKVRLITWSHAPALPSYRRKAA